MTARGDILLIIHGISRSIKWDVIPTIPLETSAADDVVQQRDSPGRLSDYKDDDDDEWSGTIRVW